jgi:hypothetical protein
VATIFPTVELPPTTPFTLQPFTPKLLLSPVTAAAKETENPIATVPVAGAGTDAATIETETETLELIVNAEVPVLLVSATDLAVMVTCGGFGCTTGGAL